MERHKNNKIPMSSQNTFKFVVSLKHFQSKKRYFKIDGLGRHIFSSFDQLLSTRGKDKDSDVCPRQNSI